MWMSPPFTCGSTRTASTPSAIRRSLLSLLTNPWGRTLALPLSTFFHPLACFTPSCPFVAVTNSPFLCVVPVSRKSRLNPFCNARITAITGTLIGCYAVLGAPLSWSKQWKRITSYTKFSAFSRSPKLDRSLCGLCQYLVKNQEGISWVAQLVPDRGSKTGVYSSLPGAGGDLLGHQPDGEKSRWQSQSQVNAQQVPVLCSFFVLPFHTFSSLFPSWSFLGQIW